MKLSTIYTGSPDGEKPSMDNKWFVEFYDQKRIRKYGHINRGKTIKERMELAEELKSIIDEALIAKYKGKDNTVMLFTLKDAMQFSVDRKKGQWAPKSLSNCNSVIKAFYEITDKKGLTNRPVDLITRPIAREILDSMVLERKLGDHAYNKYKTWLFSLFRTLIDYEKIEINPFDFKSSRKKPKPKKRILLTPSETKRVAKHIEEINPGFMTYLMFVNMTTARPKEVFYIKAGDIKLEQGVILLRGADLKDKEDRMVIIPLELEERIKAFGLHRFPPNFYIFGWDFVPEARQHPVRRDRATKYYQENVKKALGVQADMYALKHLGLRSMRSQGIEPEAAQLQAGHASYDETIGYAGLDRPELMQQLRKFKGDL